MSHSRSSRVVSLFSSQARGILKEPLLLLRHTTTGQETRCENGACTVHWFHQLRNFHFIIAEAVIGQPDVELPGFEEPRGAASELQCLSCHVMFDVRAEQVPHYRLDWHRYNLKRKLKGLTHVTQEEFEMEAGLFAHVSSPRVTMALQTSSNGLTHLDILNPLQEICPAYQVQRVTQRELRSLYRPHPLTPPTPPEPRLSTSHQEMTRLCTLSTEWSCPEGK